MDRIKCKQCGKKFSDSKDSCPRCGMSAKRTGQVRLWRWVVCLVALGGSIAVVSWGVWNRQGREKGVRGMSRAEVIAGTEEKTYKIPSLEELVSTKPEDVGSYDIAVMNLLCAQGLPGAEHVDIEECLKVLDEWSKWVKHETDRHMYRFRKAPHEYENSEGYFRVLFMICVLQEDFKVCYNRDPKMRSDSKTSDPRDLSFFRNARDLFVHGLVTGKHEGTCSSMPVFYVAIGRRLGYPLKLVAAKGHLFARWDDGKKQFNIEGTNRGLNTFSDEHYMQWPRPITQEEVDKGLYLRSFTPAQELACFLSLRSTCLLENNRVDEGKSAIEAALRYDPDDIDSRHMLGIIAQYQREVVARRRKQSLLEAASALRESGQEEAAQRLLSEPQPHMVTPMRSKP